jgi:DedD protein
MAASEPANDVPPLVRRARRRLIGAIALVLVAVIALPMIFDSERKVPDGEISIHIPSQDVLPAAALAKPAVEPAPRDASAGPRAAPEIPKPAAPRADAGQSDAPKPEQKAAPAKPEPAAKAAPLAKADASGKSDSSGKPIAPGKAEGTPGADAARAAAILEGRAPPDGGFAVQIGAFGAEDKVREAREKLGAAGIRTYTEKLETRGGERTRVRAGPFAARDAAETARDRIRALGFTDATVVAR